MVDDTAGHHQTRIERAASDTAERMPRPYEEIIC